MFRIDRTLVNLSTANIASANTEENERYVRQPSDLPGEPREAQLETVPEPKSAELEGPSAAELEMKKAEETLLRARSEAAEIVKKAEEKARKIAEAARAEVEAARAETDDIRKDAYREGYAHGERDGNDAAARALELKAKEADETLQMVIEELNEARSRVFGEIENEVIGLTLAIAKKIVNFAGENDDTVFESMINNALKQMNVGGKLAIRVGVREYDRFFSSGSAVFTLSDGTSVTASVTRDPLMGGLDCIIDTEEGTVNAGLDSQLKYIELAFGEADRS